MKILDMSAGARAVWFDKSHPDAVFVDIRPEVNPDIVADTRALPAEVGTGFDLVLFDPPHNTAEEIRSIIEAGRDYKCAKVRNTAGRKVIGYRVFRIYQDDRYDSARVRYAPIYDDGSLGAKQTCADGYFTRVVTE